MISYTKDTWPKDRWPNFSFEEMACRCGCGQCWLEEFFMDEIQSKREYWGAPWDVGSGYRCPMHPIERVKKKPGAHSWGCAIDVFPRPRAGETKAQSYYYFFSSVAIVFAGVGIDNDFWHLDDGNLSNIGLVRPALFLYPPDPIEGKYARQELRRSNS